MQSDLRATIVITGFMATVANLLGAQPLAAEMPPKEGLNVHRADHFEPSNIRYADHIAAPEPVQAPPHPPIDQIPPMPMPPVELEGDEVPAPTAADDQHRVILESGVTFFDAKTGEWFEIPASLPQGLAEGRVMREYQRPVGITGDELLRSFGSMTAATDLTQYPASSNVKLVMRFTDQDGIVHFLSARARWLTLAWCLPPPTASTHAISMTASASLIGLKSSTFILPGMATLICLTIRWNL